MQQTTTGGGQQVTVDRSFETTIQKFSEAFNRFDAREVASFWAEDGTLLNPVGNYGKGRAEVERVFREDAQTILGGSTTRFTIGSVRPIGSDCLLADLDHELQNFLRPDGSRGPARLHLVLLARREGQGWRWLDARPYRIMERPHPLH
jgi:uncharacterized protein (TIGR02246 family)